MAREICKNKKKKTINKLRKRFKPCFWFNEKKWTQGRTLYEIAPKDTKMRLEVSF